MARVVFRCGEDQVCDVPRGSSLRDVQKLLCRVFRQRFPAMKAILTIDGVTYDQFYKFPVFVQDAICIVHFIETDDPFFYDLADRKGIKPTWQEEVEYDDAVAAGDTISDLEGWVSKKRCLDASVIL